MIEVILEPHEMLAAKLVGNMRTLCSRQSGIVDKKMGDQSGIQTDEDGAIAEMAFCKHWNIYFDPSVRPRSQGYDCILKGKRIDIKSTRHKDGHLVATMKINTDVDIFVLAIIDENKVTFIGMATASELYYTDNVKNFGFGDGYALPQSALRKFKDV